MLQVLSVMTACVSKFKVDVLPHVPRIMDGVFRCTLEMLMPTWIEFPEHRLNFFKLLEALVNDAFMALFSMDGDTVKLVVDSLIWGFKHSYRDIAETVRVCMCVCVCVSERVSE
jgi:exportin-1